MELRVAALPFVEAVGTAGEPCGYRAGAGGCRGRSRRSNAVRRPKSNIQQLRGKKVESKCREKTYNARYQRIFLVLHFVELRVQLAAHLKELRSAVLIL